MQFLEQRESDPVAAILGKARSLFLNSVAQEGQEGLDEWSLILIPFSQFFPKSSALWGWYPGCTGQEDPSSSQALCSLIVPPNCGCITPRVTRGAQENKNESWHCHRYWAYFCCLSLKVARLLSPCGDSSALQRDLGCCTTACHCFEQCLHSSPLFLIKHCAASAEQANNQKCPVTCWKAGCLVSCCVKLVPQKDNRKLCSRTLSQLASWSLSAPISSTGECSCRTYCCLLQSCSQWEEGRAIKTRADSVNYQQ